ncbi:MAG: multicopper oxidase domain-containing protein [Gemmatimonadaceae bacterium]
MTVISMPTPSQCGNFPLLVMAFLAATVSCRQLARESGRERSLSSKAAPSVAANDNRVKAGLLRDGELRIKLTIGTARWYPEAEGGPSVDVAAFAEEGERPQIPAPLIRVPIGTIIVASVHNSLSDSTVYVHGLATRPSAANDTLALLPGERRTVRFAAGAAGTYLYYATIGAMNRFALRPNPEQRRRIGEREQLSGAFVVDSANARGDDRIFVVNIWGDPKDSAGYRNAVTINGKSWPHTERISATAGDSLRWRVVNGSSRGHPMHLHGFYFRVDARGAADRDTTYSPDERRLAVTESLAPGNTMSMVWSPDRSGNWLFHCHTVSHVTDGARLPHVGVASHADHDADPMVHMAGLVLGISVRPARGFVETPRGVARQMSLFVNEGKPSRAAPRALSFVLQRGNISPAVDSVEIPGSVLVLTRGEPTDIKVVNRLGEGMSVHWHGIELESFSDGVAGWSGMDGQVAPIIAPKDSFTARLTMPRAGTFIYHTHLNDIEQLTSGLYGAIVVLEPGSGFDPSRDHVFVAAADGRAAPNNGVVNGEAAAPPMEFAAGVTHRMRFVNINPGGAVVIRLRRDSTAMQWRQRAKDGADLPATAARIGPAVRRLDAGETFDAEFTPPAAGEYTLAIGAPNSMRMYTRKIIVR